MRPFSDRFFRTPSVQLLSTAVPVSDNVVHIANEDGVMRKVEQACLLRPYSYFALKLVARPLQIALNPPPDCRKPRNEQSKYDEHCVIGNFGSVHVERVSGLSEVIVEGQRGQDQCDNRGTNAGIPYGQSNRDQKNRKLYIFDVMTGEENTDSKRDRNRHYCQAVALKNQRDSR